jgi:Cu/Ag efflux protein CusF
MLKIVAVGIGKLSIILILLLGLAACGSSNHANPPKSTVHTYTIRGQVEAVPVADKPGIGLIIHHESIPGFVDISGKVADMKSMTMSFVPAKGLSLAAIKPGDKVEFVLSVDWSNNRSQITKITVLPADTKLNFGGEMPAMNAHKQK